MTDKLQESESQWSDLATERRLARERENADRDFQISHMKRQLDLQERGITSAETAAEMLSKQIRMSSESEVWLRIYCALANCSNATAENAEKWADRGLELYKKRFPNRGEK